MALANDLDGAGPVLEVATMRTAPIEPEQIGLMGNFGVMVSVIKLSD
jgi:hypothetical protein